MRASKLGFFAVLALAFTVSVVAHSLGTTRVSDSWQSSPHATAAQSPPQATSESAKPQAAPSGSRRRQAPCWRLAGISSALVNQRWHIEDNAKGKISAVCTDPTLAAEKKREKIQEINEETEQEIAKLIPAKQLEAFKACQAERDQENAQRDREEAKRQGAAAEKKLGPCGGVVPEQSGASQHPQEH